jgi:hypothetical protein
VERINEEKRTCLRVENNEGKIKIFFTFVLII